MVLNMDDSLFVCVAREAEMLEVLPLQWPAAHCHPGPRPQTGPTSFSPSTPPPLLLLLSSFSSLFHMCIFFAGKTKPNNCQARDPRPVPPPSLLLFPLLFYSSYTFRNGKDKNKIFQKKTFQVKIA